MLLLKISIFGGLIMKKLLLVLILFIFAAGKVQAMSNFIPQWSEFCPDQYINAEQMEYKKMSGWKTFLYAVSIIGYRYILNNRNIVNNNNYWVDRRHSFENEIGLCNESESTNDKISCYMKVRQLEVERNHQLEEEQIARQQLQITKEQLYSQQRELYELYRLNNNK